MVKWVNSDSSNTADHNCCVQGLVATSPSPPQWSSADQAEQLLSLMTVTKNCSRLPFPKGCTMGIPASCWTSSSQIALSVLALGCVLEMIKVLLSNSKQGSSSASVNTTERSWLRGGEGKRGRRELCTSHWASRNRIFLPGWSPGLSHRIFNLLQVDSTARVALAAVANQTHYNYSYNIKMKKFPWKQFCAFDTCSVLLIRVCLAQRLERNNQARNKEDFLKGSQNAMFYADLHI